MLTPEERQRIEEEEGKRIAEEQYRAEVRSKLKGQSSPPPPVKQSNRLPWILGIGAALIVGAIIWSGSGNRSSAGDDRAPVAQAASKPAPVRN